MDGTGFDELHERRGTQSIKWSLGEKDGAWVEYPIGPDEGPENVELLPMWLADMDFPTAPAVIEAMQRRLDHGIFGYTALDDEFYEAVISWEQRRHGWTIDRDWIVTNSGVMPAINLMIQTFTDSGDGVIVQPPVFHPIPQAVVLNGRRLVTNPLRFANGRYEMDLADLETKAASGSTRMMLLCSPHNPVGRVWTPEELRTVADICAQNDLLLVSDEIHGDLTHSWSHFRSVGSLGAQHLGGLAVCTSPSKAFNLPGLKTSLTIIPDDNLREAYLTTLRNQNELFGANLFGITAVKAAYTAGEQWLESLLDYLADNVGFVESYLADRLPHLRLVRPDALYLLWIDCRALNLSGADLDARLRDAGVWVEQGATYGIEGDGFIRMTIACPRSVLEKAMKRVEQALGTDGESPA